MLAALSYWDQRQALNMILQSRFETLEGEFKEVKSLLVEQNQKTMTNHVDVETKMAESGCG